MVEGGFSSRALFVVQNKPRPPRPRPVKSDRTKELELMLIEDIKAIHQLKGEFRWTRDAEIHFDEWYVREYDKIDKADVRLRAYYGRKGEHLLKLAMVLSASRNDSMLITPFDIDSALTFLGQVEAQMAHAFRGFGLANSTKNVDRILQQIEENGGSILYHVLMKKNHLYLQRDELEKVLDTLISANMISYKHLPGVKKEYFII
jgi:hypothetical protein